MNAHRDEQDRPQAMTADADVIALQSAIDLTRDWQDPVEVKQAKETQKQLERSLRGQVASAVAWQRNPFLIRAFRRWRADLTASTHPLESGRLPQDCARLLSLRQTGEDTVEAEGVLEVPHDWPALRLRTANSEGGSASLTVERIESRPFPSRHPIQMFFVIRDEFANVRDWYLEIADAHLSEWRKVMHWKLWHRDGELKYAPSAQDPPRKMEVSRGLAWEEHISAPALDLSGIEALPQKRAALIGVRDCSVIDSADYQRLLALSGDNFGNEAIKSACSEVLSDAPLAIFPTAENQSANASDDYDVLVIAASNFLSERSDMSQLAHYLESTDLPILTMGLGAQASKEEMASGQKIPLSPGTLRFLRIISERCGSIGVRGEFTADQLRLHGIHNVTIIGCPSFYAKPLNLMKAFSAESAPVSREQFRFLYSSTPSILKDPLRRDPLLRFHRDSLEQGGDFVLQNEIEMLRGRQPGPAGLADRLVVARWFGCTKAEEVRALLSSRCYASADLEAWRAKSSAYHFSLGPRLHGNIVAMQAGVPALLLNHDSRTEELSRALELPTVDITSMRHGVNVYGAYLETRSQSGFSSRYLKKAATLLEFLKTNKMRPGARWLAELERAFDAGR